MKTILYIAAVSILILITSCKSVNKLVDQGRYDEAIVLATKKLAGKKNKKTKHIVALEKAFAKVNHYDLNHIKQLKYRAANGDSRAWEAIFDYGLKIQDRQAHITPFLPLVSKDNYVGSFDLIDTEPILTESADHAASFLYLHGQEQLAQSKELNDKLLAQEAHYTFLKIGKFYNDYKDVSALLSESARLGTFHVLLKEDESALNTLSLDFITAYELSRLHDKWTQYHIDFEDDIVFDAVTIMEIIDIDISPESEVINNFNEQRELERWVDETDSEGNIVTDTSGNPIRYREVEIVRASITEVVRSKDARVSGLVETIDYSTGRLIDSDSFTHEINFNSDGCDLIGDRRALSDGVRKRIDLSISPFPSDYDMTTEAISNITDDFLRYISKQDFRTYYRDLLVSR